jgi:NTE family protein
MAGKIPRAYPRCQIGGAPVWWRPMAKSTLRSWLAEGPYTLALSSSFFGFYAHAGVAEAFSGAVPAAAKFTGSSAGALVGGALSSGLTPLETRDLLFGIKKLDFWDPGPGFGLLKGQKFRRVLERNFVKTFREANTPIEVAVFDLLSFRTRFLSEGSLPEAIVASCAVPLLFHPVRRGGRILFDGGVFHKSGINLAHSQERTLCVFLQHTGFADAYELGRSLGKLGPNQKVLRLKNLPKVDYNSLGEGRTAYAEARRRTLLALDSKLSGTIIEA